jgi:cellobiose dehydrogenase (acceptor)
MIFEQTMLTMNPQIFVVDASVFPGMVTTNPSSLIMAVAERASERILAL